MAQPSTTADHADGSPIASATLLGVGLAMVSYALSELLNIPALLYIGLAIALPAAVLYGLAASLVRRRTRPIRDLHAALARTLGADFTRKHMKAAAWQEGLPTRLQITYPPTFNERDDKTRAEVRDIIAKRMGGSVEATWMTTKRRLVATITQDPAATQIVDGDAPAPVVPFPDDTPERARLRSRADDVVQSIMGATANITDIAFDGDTPSTVEVRYQTTSRDLSANFRQRVIMQLDHKLPGQWADRWDLENDTVTFRQRPPFPSNVRYPLGHKLANWEIPYAVTEENRIESWKLGSKHPHCLVVGPTGSGKTVFIRNLIVGARLFGIPVVLCDPKMTEYLDFIGIPGVTVITDAREIARAITLTHDEMMRRYVGIKNRTARKGEYGKLLFVLDEFFVFKEAIQEVWQAMRAADRDIKGKDHPCISHWRKLIVLARTAEIHLVVGIQRPDAEFLTGLARDSLRKRIALDQATPEAARMMWGSQIGTDLPSVQGRAMAMTVRGPEQVQVLRLLTPEDVDDYDEQDAAVWNQLLRRMTEHGQKGDPLAFLGALGEQVPTAAIGADTSARLLEASDVVRAEAEQSSVDPSVEADLQEVGVYELAVGDRIQVYEQDLIVVDDLHFGEDDEGQEVVEVHYTSAAGTPEVLQLTVEDMVLRTLD